MFALRQSCVVGDFRREMSKATYHDCRRANHLQPEFIVSLDEIIDFLDVFGGSDNETNSNKLTFKMHRIYNSPGYLFGSYQPEMDSSIKISFISR